MILLNADNKCILAECEACGQEIKIDKNTTLEDDNFETSLITPVLCECGTIDGHIKKQIKSTFKVRRKLAVLLDLLDRQGAVSDRINQINNDINRTFYRLSFIKLAANDFKFSSKVFLMSLAIGFGLEILAFIICGLLIFSGITFDAEGLALAGNIILYNINVFKSFSLPYMKLFGFSAEVPLLDSSRVRTAIILDYLPHALAGLLAAIIYAFLLILLVRLLISVTRIIMHYIKINSYKHEIKEKLDEYNRYLTSLNVQHRELGEKIQEQSILPVHYKTKAAVETIYGYFDNWRVDTISEAINLYHTESRGNKILEYQKHIYHELTQAKGYIKSMYIMSSDEIPDDEESDEGDAAPEESPLLSLFAGTASRLAGRLKQPKSKTRAVVSADSGDNAIDGQ